MPRKKNESVENLSLIPTAEPAKSTVPAKKKAGAMKKAVEFQLPDKGPSLTVFEKKKGEMFGGLDKGPALSQEEEERKRSQLRTVDDSSKVSLRQSLTFLAVSFFNIDRRINNEALIMRGKGYEIEFAPSAFGAPTFYDSDVLTYVMSVLAKSIKNARAEGKSKNDLPYMSDVVFRVSDLNRRIGKSNARNSDGIIEALKRLRYTSLTVKFNDEIGDTRVEKEQSTSFIESFEWVTLTSKKNPEKTETAIKVRLVPWLVRDIATDYTLWIPDEYYKLKPLEKSIFMLARGRISLREFTTIRQDSKSTNQLTIEEFENEPVRPKFVQSGSSTDYFYERITLSELRRLLRSKSPERKLRQSILKIIREDRIPLYELALDKRPRDAACQVLYIFRKDSRTTALKLDAELCYPGMRETLRALTTREKLIARENAIDAEATVAEVITEPE